MEKSNNKDQFIGIHAGLLTAAEVGVGSFMHAFHLPFTGYILSLNQALLLTKAIDDGGVDQPKGMTASISSIAAVLKSLSPMGKRVTPMLAIAMQGLLYNLGIFVAGRGFFGKGLGACLLATWGFIQPILIYYVIFGNVLFAAIFNYIDPEWFWGILAGMITLKCFIAVAVVELSSGIPARWWAKWVPLQTQIKENSSGWKSAAWKALKDLMMFPFIFTLGLSGLFLYGLLQNIDAVIWELLRPLAMGYLIFFLLRILPLNKLTLFLESSPQLPLSRSLSQALKNLKA